MPIPTRAVRHITRESSPAIPRLKKFFFILFVTSLEIKNAPCNDDAFREKCVLLLCVADIDFIRATSGLLIPNPHIGDFVVLGISVEIATNIPFGVFAFYTCGDGVIPAIHGSAVKRKSDALSVALGKADPVVNVKGGSGGVDSSVAGGVGCSFSVGAAVSGRRSDSSVFFSGSLGCGSTAVLWSA